MSVSLWRMELGSLPHRAMRETLSADERARADRFRFPRDRDEWTAARAGLRSVLGRTLHCAPGDVCFALGPHGKPRLASDEGHAHVRFNLSHTRGLALLAVTEGAEVGVDMERVRADFDPCALAVSVFVPDEIECVRNAPPCARHAVFFRIWTAREAVVKQTGAGLTGPVPPFSVAAFADGEEVRALGLRVLPVPVGACYAAALALPDRVCADFVMETWTHETLLSQV